MSRVPFLLRSVPVLAAVAGSISFLALPTAAHAGEPIVVDDGTERADDFVPDDGKKGDRRDDAADRDDDDRDPPRKKKRRSRDEDEEEDDGEPPTPEERDRIDRARFRGGVAGTGSAIIIPTETYSGESSTVVLGAIGVNGQIGVQINNLVGLYVVPGIDVIFGEAGGLGVSAALLVDFTIEDMVSIGVGPDVGAFAAIGVDIGSNASSSTFAGGANAGARLHLAVHPVWGLGRDDVRRKAFTIALDTRLLGGFGVAASCSGSGCDDGETGATDFVFSPVLSLGYTAF